MGRIRTIKPEFWKNEELSELPEATHMLAASLLNYADDEGYFNANLGLVRAECSPLREPSVSVQDSLNHLREVGYLELLVGRDGKRYGHIIKFTEHQRVNRPTPSKIKEIILFTEESVSGSGDDAEASPTEGNGKEGKVTRERVALGEEFWKVYPHPPNPGSKRKTVERINKLPEKTQRAAIESIARFKLAIDDQRKKIKTYQPPMAQTYVNDARWEGFEALDVSYETLSTAPLHPDPECQPYWEAMRKQWGDAVLRSWFMNGDEPAVRKNCTGFIIVTNSDLRVDRINQQYKPRLDDIFGKRQWRIEREG